MTDLFFKLETANISKINIKKPWKDKFIFQAGSGKHAQGATATLYLIISQSRQ